MDLFTVEDFKVFDIKGFNERMGAIMMKIRPKLTEIGEELGPKISQLVDQPLFVHVAKHARRTVNPPDDTWAAFGADKRGYKKDVHFKVAISRHCVRFLFEVGPEYYDKSEWTLKWHRESKAVVSPLRSAKDIGWFKDEHDEDPAALLKQLGGDGLKQLGGELTRRKDGQLVFGRRLDQADVARLEPKDFERIALATFKPLAPLFQLHDLRVLA